MISQRFRHPRSLQSSMINRLSLRRRQDIFAEDPDHTARDRNVIDLDSDDDIEDVIVVAQRSTQSSSSVHSVASTNTPDYDEDGDVIAVAQKSNQNHRPVHSLPSRPDIADIDVPDYDRLEDVIVVAQRSTQSSSSVHSVASTNTPDYDAGGDATAVAQKSNQNHRPAHSLPSRHDIVDIDIPGYDRLEESCSVFTNDGVEIEIRPNTTVELTDGSFLRVLFIVTRDSDTTLQGILLQRGKDINFGYRTDDATSLGAILQLANHEVCAVIRIKDRSTHTDIHSDLVERPMYQVKRVREVIFTNFDHFAEMQSNSTVDLTNDKYDRLFCRLKFITELRVKTSGSKPVGIKLLHVRDSECDPGFWVSDNVKFENYQLSKKCHFEDQKIQRQRLVVTRETEIIDLTGDNVSRSKQTTIKQNWRIVKHTRDTKFTSRRQAIDPFHNGSLRNTNLLQSVIPKAPVGNVRNSLVYHDVFSGPGGTALGAKMAGFSVRSLLDHDEAACQTLRYNFPGARVHEMDISEYIVDPTLTPYREMSRIAVMHVSFPCKGFSALNRGLNPARDEMHRDLVYGLKGLIEKSLPRVVTLEQVPGIFHRNKGEGRHFYEQIWALYSLGYSVQFKVLNYAEYGVPQARKRLMAMAACPGQRMPPWPKPTHGDGSGLKPFVTVREALSDVSRMGNREPGVMGHCKHRQEPPRLQDLDQPLKELIATSNWPMYPRGGRTFTVRELSCLQTFPSDYRYGGRTVGEVHRQIGDAVPPAFAKAFFESIRRTIEEQDEDCANTAD